VSILSTKFPKLLQVRPELLQQDFSQTGYPSSRIKTLTGRSIKLRKNTMISISVNVYCAARIRYTTITWSHSKSLHLHRRLRHWISAF